MDITKVIFNKNDTGDKSVISLVDIVLDYDFIIKNIKYKQGLKGNYLIFPKDYCGRDIAYPIDEECRKYIYERIENDYKEYKA